MTNPDGPWIQAAFFCLNVSKDDENQHTFSAITDGGESPGEPGARLVRTLVVSLAGGNRPRSVTLRIVAHVPGDPPSEVMDPLSLWFDGPGFGRHVMRLVPIPTDREGTIWFDVLLDDDIATRVPFRVILPIYR